MPVAKITSIYSPWTDNLETYEPKSTKNFRLDVHFFLSFKGEDYGDQFTLSVCTPAWIEEHLTGKGFLSGIHTLIVSRYDFKQISTYINDLVGRFDEDDFLLIARKLHGFAEWEGWTILSEALPLNYGCVKNHQLLRNRKTVSKLNV